MTTATRVEFEVIPGWGRKLPNLMIQDISDIDVGPNDDIYLLYRDLRSVIVAGPDGEHRRTVAAGQAGSRAHGVTAGQDGQVFVVDEGDHCVRIFDRHGQKVKGFGSGPTNPQDKVVTRGYPPFSRPTRLAFDMVGNIFVSDGYGNARVHQFSNDFELVNSWGEPGIGAAEFNTPHAVFVDSQGRVLVCDRENDRIQVFTSEGNYVEEWTDFHRPQAIIEDADGLYFVPEGQWRAGHVSPRLGPVDPQPSRVSILRGDGRVVQRIGGMPPKEPGQFFSAHGIAMDSNGDLYVAEVASSALKNFPDPTVGEWIALQKFRRV